MPGKTDDQTTRILLVDDSELVLEAVGLALCDAGHAVDTALSGAVALQKAATAAYDLFIVDVVMPELDGFEVAKRLREIHQHRHAPILMLSQLDGTSHRVKGLEHADDFIAKGISDAELLARVRSLVHIGALRRDAAERAERIAGVVDAMPTDQSGGRAVGLILHPSQEVQTQFLYLLVDSDREILAESTSERATAVLAERGCVLVVCCIDVLLREGCLVRQAIEAMSDRPAIIALDNEASVDRRIAALDAGADDYVYPSMPHAELSARVNGAFRRMERARTERMARDLAVRSATADGLTGLHNRAHFDRTLSSEIAKARQESHAVSLIMVDLDHFKLVNDRHGHQAGDRVLVEIARRLCASLRPEDLCARYGGEEMVVILPQTSREGAEMVAERLRSVVADTPVASGDDELDITASFGLATFPDDAQSVEDLLRRADEALYLAKNSGRNRVVSWPDGAVTPASNASADGELDLSATLGWMLADGMESSFSSIREVAQMLSDNLSPGDSSFVAAEELHRACEVVARTLRKMMFLRPLTIEAMAVKPASELSS